MKLVLIQVKGDCSTNAVCSMKTWRFHLDKLIQLYIATAVVGGEVEENISTTDNHVFGHVVIFGKVSTRIVLEINTIDVPRQDIVDLLKEEEK